MSDQILARDKLLEGGYSCVLVRNGDVVMTSYDKGIKPIFLEITGNKNLLKGASMADKVVGKALALLSLFAGIKSVYGRIMSGNAKNVLENNGINVEYSEVVPYVMNKDKTDHCLMEKLVNDTEDPEEAFNMVSSFFEKNPSDYNLRGPWYLHRE